MKGEHIKGSELRVGDVVLHGATNTYVEITHLEPPGIAEFAIQTELRPIERRRWAFSPDEWIFVAERGTE